MRSRGLSLSSLFSFHAPRIVCRGFAGTTFWIAGGGGPPCAGGGALCGPGGACASAGCAVTHQAANKNPGIHHKACLVFTASSASLLNTAEASLFCIGRSCLQPTGFRSTFRIAYNFVLEGALRLKDAFYFFDVAVGDSPPKLAGCAAAACALTSSTTARIAAITVSGRSNGIMCVLSSTICRFPFVERC